MDFEFQTLVLAAGQGTRMKSSKIKVLHEVCGKPILGHVIDSAIAAGSIRLVVVVGHQREQVEAYLEANYSGRYYIAEQDERLGTGHAVYCAADYLSDGPGHTFVVSGDVPNMDADTLKAFWDASKENHFAMMTAEVDDPAHYGRVLRKDGKVSGVVEYRDATPEQRAITEVNTGFYMMRSRLLRNELELLMSRPPKNAQGEYYFTDIIEEAAGATGVEGFKIQGAERMQGVNTRQDLARAEKYAQQRLRDHWMSEGVTFLDPDSTYLEVDVQLAPDVTLHPGVHLRGKTTVGEGALLENGVVATDSTIEDHAHIKASSYLDNAHVGSGSTVGPFAHLRPGAHLGRECKVGNFVEIKKSRLGDGAKASHLSYLGDAEIGEGANVGAGTITCNYDGKNKHVTQIGSRAFIGSNTALVAPVSVGDGAFVGAGSTVTKDVPDGALAVARGRQQNIDGWARRRTMRDEEE